MSRVWDGSRAAGPEIVRMRIEPGASGLAVAVDAGFHADPPPPGPPGAFDGLWEFEVVELFLLGDGERYLEVELGPHGHHLVLELHGRRQALRRALPIGFTAGRDGARWRGQASIPWSYVPAGPLRGNAYAIHGVGASRRYLAWAPVPGEGPDFHRLDCFRPLPFTRP